MGEESVRSEILINSAEGGVRLGRPPCTRDSAHRIDHDRGRVDESGPQQRRNGERRSSWITAGNGDGVGANDRGPEEFRQPIDELRKKFRDLMDFAVPLRVQRCVEQSEISGEIDDPPNPLPEFSHERLRGPVRQPTEHEIYSGEHGGFVGHEMPIAIRSSQTWIELGDADAGLGVTRGERHLESGMGMAQPEEFRTGETRCADDADVDHWFIVASSA